MNNKFIVIEGLDGSGKTTVISKIVQYLNSHNIYNIVITHEPGGTPISNILGSIIKYGSATESINDISELLMIYAARSQLLENVIKPSLSQGYWVIGDRYDISSYAYQGGGRGIDESLLNILSKKVVNNLLPDLILYLDVAPEIGLARIKNRDRIDRIEQESLFFFNRVRSYYKKLAHVNDKIITINANQDLKKVFVDIHKCLDLWLFYNLI